MYALATITRSLKGAQASVTTNFLGRIAELVESPSAQVRKWACDLLENVISYSESHLAPSYALKALGSTSKWLDGAEVVITAKPLDCAPDLLQSQYPDVWRLTHKLVLMLAGHEFRTKAVCERLVTLLNNGAGPPPSDQVMRGYKEDRTSSYQALCNIRSCVLMISGGPSTLQWEQVPSGFERRQVRSEGRNYTEEAVQFSELTNIYSRSEFEMPSHGRYHNRLIYRLDSSLCFDLDSQDVVRHLEDPLCQLSSAMDVPFAHADWTEKFIHSAGVHASDSKFNDKTNKLVLFQVELSPQAIAC
ncbi:hypothetical protein DFH09DRAFT_1097884 [Mycena vulgaris]|nr:hypothetical protein DFH09DRAFT_1097884 [Mycena vulgaris]